MDVSARAPQSCRRGRRLRLWVAVVAAGILAAAVLPGAAKAHGVLVESSPAAGARLATAPAEITLRFNEPFVQGSEHVSIRRKDGTSIPVPSPASTRALVRQDLPAGLAGIFVVSWHVLSDDGHLSAGEFAFSVGSGGALPSVAASDDPTPWSQVVAGWVFFVGLALAFGGLLSELLVWRGRGPHAPAIAGVALAAVSTLVLFILLAGARTGGGLADGLRGESLRATAGGRPGALTLTIFAALAAAALLLAVDRRRTAVLAPLTAAAVLTSVRGHAGTGGHWWALTADVLHVLAAAAWVGALVHLVLTLVGTPDRAAAGRDSLPRYARLALPTVAVVVLSGIVSAFAELGSLDAVLHTSYGQTLAVKSVLVVAALTIAAATRLLTLPSGPRIGIPLLRRLAVSECALVIAVLAAVGLLVNLAPPRGDPATVGAVAPPALDAPALQVAGFAGKVAVGLAASAGELEFTILPPPGDAAAGYELTAQVNAPDGTSADLFPRGCGSGCFSIAYALRDGATRVTALVSRRGGAAIPVRFDLSAPLPSPEPQLLADAIRTLRTAPGVDVTEQLGDGVKNLTEPTSFRLAGRSLVEMEPIDAVGVRVTSEAGDLRELRFATAGSSAWYRLWIDDAARVRREEIVSAGLSTQRTFTYPGVKALASAPVIRSTIPTGPFTSALEDDDLAVAFAAQPAGPGRLRLTTTVIGPDGDGAAGLRVGLALQAAATSDGRASPCGPGCYRATLAFSGQPRTALVTIERLGHVPSTVRFTFPSSWPPVSATALARRATSVFTGLSSVSFDERLASSLSRSTHSTWRLEAPDRLTYAIEGGSSAVIIGARRWDREAGAAWIETDQQPVQQPTAEWGSAPSEAALIGSGQVAGRPVWRISFVTPDVPSWFTVEIEKRTGRTLALQMIAPAHFMQHVYSEFDTPATIRPPK